MPTTRFRSRHLHATVVMQTSQALNTLGWITPPINFGTEKVTVVDYMPDDRGTVIRTNTVAVSLADFSSDVDEELGVGLRAAPYSIFLDVYMAEQALSHAICDDIRDIFTDATFPLINQITGAEEPNTRIEVDEVIGPERPAAAVGAESFKRYWRTMRLDVRLFFLV